MVTRSSRKKPGKKLGFFVLVLILFPLLGAAAFFYNLVKDLPSPERITERVVAESTKIFDRTGKVILYEIHGEEKRTVIPFEEIPEIVKQATVAAEDINFYKHSGIDWRGIVRAALKNLARGNIAQGGSTITQQLVKNSLLGPERTFRRKIREQILAIILERKYSKDEILEFYLNQIPYGSNAYGIYAAAQTYFAKEVKELTSAEAAMLAALPKAPTYYSPYGSRKEELLSRRNWILERMADEGFIDKKEAERAGGKALLVVPSRSSIRAPHFVLYVREYLGGKFGEEFIEKGGLRVITTLDWELQQEAEKAVKEGAERNEKLVQAANAALVAIDPKSGEILAMAGSKDYWSAPEPKGCHPGIDCRFDPHVNVTLRQRQPGSAFKPFVYATAFKKGYTPETILFDVPTEFNTNCNYDGTLDPLVGEEKDCYHPRNYDGKFRGPVSLKQALAQSLNVPSAKLLYLAGVMDSIKTAEGLGIATLTSPERYGLSLVLGGAEVTLFEITSAFGVFAQEGILAPKTSILRIENAKGEILEENRVVRKPAMDTEVARVINALLSDNNARVPVFSPQSSLYFPDRQVAAKTGTTQDFRDAWVIGYTPSLVAGVWVGNNDNSPMNQEGLSIMVAGPIWHRFLEFALGKTPPEEFTKPNPEVQTDKPILRGLYRSGGTVKIDKISKKLATVNTPFELIEEISIGEVKTILAQVSKDDPRGSAPLTPATDPQFKNWQAGIDAWLSQNPLPQPEIPKDFDDLHTPAKVPQIAFISPAEGKILSEVKNILVKIRAAFPLREVSLFIEDELTSTRTSPILGENINFILTSPLGKGQYKIKITAYDAVGNKETKEMELTVSLNE